MKTEFIATDRPEPDFAAEDAKGAEKVADVLSRAFPWCMTAPGHEFWRDVHTKLLGLAHAPAVPKFQPVTVQVTFESEDELRILEKLSVELMSLEIDGRYYGPADRDFLVELVERLDDAAVAPDLSPVLDTSFDDHPGFGRVYGESVERKYAEPAYCPRPPSGERKYDGCGF